MQSERKYWPTDDVRRLFDDPSFEVPGQPNYRTRPGRSGFDPIDYRYEYVHVQGSVMRMLLDGKWYTDNSLMVIALIVWGLTLWVGLTISVIALVIVLIIFSPVILLLLAVYFLVVPPLLMRVYRELDLDDEEDEDLDLEEDGGGAG